MQHLSCKGHMIKAKAMREGTTVGSPVIRWQEYLASEPHSSVRWEASDRGWGFAELPSLGQSDDHRCVGFYSDYGGAGAGPARFFARAYVIQAGALGVRTVDLGEGRFRTVSVARRFVERAVRHAAHAGRKLKVLFPLKGGVLELGRHPPENFRSAWRAGAQA